MSKYIIVEIDDEALELMRKNGDETRELIQCKDCKYNNGGRCGWHGGAGYKWVVDDDDFCSCGERKKE